MNANMRRAVLGVCAAAGVIVCVYARRTAAAENPFRLPVVLDRRGTAREDTIIAVPRTARGAYSVSVAVESPREFSPQGRLQVAVVQGGKQLVGKTLYLGDPDLYTLVRLEGGGVEVRLQPEAAPASGFRYHVVVNRWPESTRLASEPNNSFEQAAPIELGTTIFGSGDEADYVEPKDHDDWFGFEFRESRPKLVYFTLDLMERDNIPPDVAVLRVENGKAVAFDGGADPVTPPHEVQALPGNKFTTRVLKDPGTYYVRVRARHPFYKLRTRVYDVPPYDDPHQAVQTAVDYIIRAGDSWHANTPRKGGLYDRVANVHQETSLCVACHPTHFSQRAQLYALRNGYAVTGRQQLQFLAERFYNNPRPFYGYEEQGATWARVISAPANVLGRMATLLQIYEQNFTGEHREKFFRGVSEYLKLYYEGRDTLPPDESNGNTPLVSAYEVAWYAWVAAPELRPQLERLLAQDHIKNMVDLCYQTLALAGIDREKYRGKIRANAERILSLQRPDGQWAMNFDAGAPEAEFQTGHALWALAEAGYLAEHPQVAKGLEYLLKRQQEFGGWLDPLQSYENFRTPFRETQMAVMALSSFYKGAAKKPEPPRRLDRRDPVALLGEMDDIWQAPSRGVIAEIEQAARSNDALVRQQAAEALGRIAHAPAAPLLKALLGDDNKMVQRTAAWALRQIITRKGQGAAEIERALADRDDRTRWGATRVFATHFSHVVDRVNLEPLAALVTDPVPAIRMQAIKGLWQWWFWDARRESRDRIENTILDAMAEPQHPWVERNLREAIYNIGDENIRYLYNNWVPLLANNEIRDRAVKGRLAVEAATAEKFARVLESGSDHQKKVLLAGLTEFHLRRADSYQAANPETLKQQGRARYVRIGNDVEQIVFHGSSADRMAKALMPLVESQDLELRREATLGAYLVREIRVKAPAYGGNRKYGWDDVLRLAGPQDENRKRLALAVLERVEDDDAVVRATAREIHREFTLDFEGEQRERVERALAKLLGSPRLESQTAALEAIHEAPTFSSGSAVLPLVRAAVLDGKRGAAAIGALQACPALFAEPPIADAVRKAMESENAALAKAALELALRNQAKLENAELRAAFEKAARDARRRKTLTEIAEAYPEVAATEIGARLVKTTAREESKPAAGLRLDYAYFQQRIEPILETRGPDGNACVDCHDTHTIFHLGRPVAGGSGERQVHQNYQSALKVVDAAAPENSLMLRKPTSDSAVEGTVGATRLSHGGGVRWPTGSAEYETILEWIKGAQAQDKSAQLGGQSR